MNKLEEKLIELGYEIAFPHSDNRRYFKKIVFVDTCMVVLLYITFTCFNKLNGYIQVRREIYSLKAIEELKQAYNQLHKDLEILKGVEDGI